MILLRRFGNLAIVNNNLWVRIEMRISVEQFKRKTLETQSHSQLKNLWLQSLKINDYHPQKFASVCRKFTHFLRKATTNQTFSLVKIFGNNYIILSKINLKLLKIPQLIDIAQFFSNASMTCFIDTKNDHVHKFINDLLQLIQFKFHQSHINRTISYLCKASKCAEFFQNKNYLNFLIELQLKIEDIQFFESITITYIILRGKGSCLVTSYEQKIFIKILEKCIDKNWVEMVGVHHILDLMHPMTEFVKKNPFQTQVKQLVNQIAKKIQQFIAKDYQYLTSQQIVRLCKFMQKIDPQWEYCLLILTKLFESIKQDGSSSIDPIFIIRFVNFIDNFSIIQKASENWQSKLINLYRHYFYKGQAPDNTVFKCLCTMISGHLKMQNKVALIHILNESILSRHHSQQVILLISKYFNLYNASNQIFKWAETATMIKHVFNLQNSMETLKLYYTYVFMILHIQFMKQLGVEVDEEFYKSQIPIVKKSLFQKTGSGNGNASNTYDNIFSIQTLSDLLRKDKLLRESCSIMRKINLRLLQQILITTHINCKYDQIYTIFSSITFIDVIVGVIIQNLLMHPIPRKYHQKTINFLCQIFNSQQKIVYMYFQQTRKTKNILMRHTALQSQLFLKFISKRPYEEKLQFFSNNAIIHFLMTYSFDRFQNQIWSIKMSKQFPVQEYQYILIRMMSILVQKSNNLDTIIKFKQKIFNQYQINADIFKYISNILYDHSICTKQELNILAQKLKANNTNDFKTLSNYKQFLGTIIRTNSFTTENQTELKQYLILGEEAYQNKQLNTWQLVRDMIRVVRHANKNNNGLTKLQMHDIFAGGLIKMAKKLQNQRYWAIQALDLAYEMKWKSNTLFESVVKIASVFQNWDTGYNAQKLLKLLLNYPNQNKWDSQFIDLLVRITLFCQDEFPYLYSQLQQRNVMELCSHNTKIYLQYMNKRLGSAHPIDQLRKQNANI